MSKSKWSADFRTEVAQEYLDGKDSFDYLADKYHIGRATTDEISLRNAIRDYMRFYRDERPQSRYNYKTPAEVRSEALSSAVPQAYPIARNKRIEKYKAK